MMIKERVQEALNKVRPALQADGGDVQLVEVGEDGVVKVGMSIINLATPVEFGSDANDPVYLIISFGGIDKESHIGMLQDLAIFLTQEENQELLKTAKSVDQVLKAFTVD